MNKFRGVQISGIAPKRPVDLPMLTFGGGFRGDASPLVLPLNTASSTLNVMFEREGIRKAYGSRTLGASAGTRILALGSHNFFFWDDYVTRPFRAFIDGSGKLKVQAWNGSSWGSDWISADLVPARLLSWTSVQDSLLFADGEKILRLGVDITQDAQENDFTAGETIDAESEETSVTVTPGGATGKFYVVYYRVELAGPDDIEVELSFILNGTEVGRKVYSRSAGELPVTLENESFELIDEIADGDTITISIIRIDSGGTDDVEEEVAFTDVGFWDFQATLDADGAWDHKYLINWLISPIPDEPDPSLNIYVDKGSGWEFLETVYSPQNSNTHEITVPGLGNGDKVRVQPSGASGANVFHLRWVRRVATTSTVVVRGNNKAVTGDTFAGVEYLTRGAVHPVFEKIQNAPAAHFVFNFGDRAIALGSADEPDQALSWSADGDIIDWLGGDSGQIFLLETRRDPVDPLVAGAPLGSSVAALYRRHSIMRLFETGNQQQAIGAVHWIEGVGTRSPFSVQVVPGGNIFLSSDLMVYYLTEGGQPVPIGHFIQQELRDASIARLDLVDSAYIDGEYLLGVPENNNDSITGVWALDFERYTVMQEVQWRRLGLTGTRLAAVGRVIDE